MQYHEKRLRTEHLGSLRALLLESGRAGEGRPVGRAAVGPQVQERYERIDYKTVEAATDPH